MSPSGGPAPLRLAHRGDHRHALENSLSAVRAALALPRCDGLELDVRASRDGVPVLLHDPDLARTHGRVERCARLTVAELEALGVPTLRAILAAVPDAAFLDLEVKEAGVVEAVLAELRSARGNRPDRAVVSSFDAAAVTSARGIAPAVPAWLNARDLAPATIARALELGCRGVSVAWQALDRAAVGRARGYGLAVAAWTVRRPDDLAALAGLGVTAVCVEEAALDA